MKELYIIRHGETEYNKLGIVQGSGVNSSLNDTGRAQALKLFQKYGQIKFDYVYTSTLKRTHETAQHFINQGATWRVRGELREIGWGVHEGQKGTKDSIQRYRDLITAWQSGDFDARLEKGESIAEVRNRLEKFLDEIKKTDFEKALICTHGRTLRCLMCLLKNEHLRAMENYDFANTSLSIVNLLGEDFKVILQNDISHLE
jgi:broad specificity phosphatase PhoE